MKFDCGPTRFEKRLARAKALEEWHDWFAWFPVSVGKRDCRWLETVQRSAVCGWYNPFFRYRPRKEYQ